MKYGWESICAHTERERERRGNAFWEFRCDGRPRVRFTVFYSLQGSFETQGKLEKRAMCHLYLAIYAASSRRRFYARALAFVCVWCARVRASK